MVSCPEVLILTAFQNISKHLGGYSLSFNSKESATTTHFKMSGERCRKNLFQMKKNADFTRIHLPIAIE